MSAEELVEPDELSGLVSVGPGAWVCAVALDDETVIYDEDTGAMHVLNPTASVIWDCLDGDATLDEIAADLAEAFGADVAAVRDDVVRTVRDFGRLGLLDGVVRPEAPPVDEAPLPETPRYLEEPPGG